MRGIPPCPTGTSVITIQGILGRCGGAEPADGRADRAGVPALLRDERSATHPRRTRKGINKQNDR